MKPAIHTMSILLALALALFCGVTALAAEEVPADEAIQSVMAIGFVDLDGAKLRAVAIEYAEDMTGADVGADTYELSGYTFTSAAAVNNGGGAPGDITAVYVNNVPETDENGGSGSGNYVIVELYTDYLYGAEQSFTNTLAVSVKQVEDITTDSGTITASENAVANYAVAANGTETREANTGASGNRGSSGMNGSAALNEGGFLVPDIEGFRFYTDDPGDYGADGPAFVATNCFDEKTGETWDELSVAYALYLPEDYSEDGRYAMVVLDNPAAAEGTHPLVSVLQTRSPAVYASDWAQELVKDKHGLDGLVVVVPVVTARVDDNACSPAQYDALVQLWDYIQSEYHVDADHVYGSGQSVGGMVLLETNRNRDNYFAGLMLYEDQWAQNYYKDMLFIRNMASSPETAATAPFHYPRTNPDLTWDYSLDTNGEPVYEGHDPNNYYWLISDDNILIMNRTANNLSNDTWTELKYLYADLAGYEFEHLITDASLNLDEQDEAIRDYLARDNELGFNWVSFENGANGYSCRKVEAGYEWLLSQDRQDEISREKLDLNKPFELADEQIWTEDRAIHYTDINGNTIYYLTGRSGAGTQFYNTCLLNMGTVADAAPGWLPEGMSWETGVSGANIVSVTAIGDHAAAIEYDADMSGLVINLKGDDIIGLDGNIREDIQIVLDPYEFYDAEGRRLDVTLKNAYVNDAPEMVEGADRGEGSGHYVIVEFDEAAAAEPTTVIQRTTVRTDMVIASASYRLYE